MLPISERQLWHVDNGERLPGLSSRPSVASLVSIQKGEITNIQGRQFQDRHIFFPERKDIQDRIG